MHLTDFVTILIYIIRSGHPKKYELIKNYESGISGWGTGMEIRTNYQYEVSFTAYSGDVSPDGFKEGKFYSPKKDQFPLDQT